MFLCKVFKINGLYCFYGLAQHLYVLKCPTLLDKMYGLKETNYHVSNVCTFF